MPSWVGDQRVSSQVSGRVPVLLSEWESALRAPSRPAGGGPGRPRSNRDERCQVPNRTGWAVCCRPRLARPPFRCWWCSPVVALADHDRHRVPGDREWSPGRLDHRVRPAPPSSAPARGLTGVRRQPATGRSHSANILPRRGPRLNGGSRPRRRPRWARAPRRPSTVTVEIEDRHRHVVVRRRRGLRPDGDRDAGQPGRAGRTTPSSRSSAPDDPAAKPDFRVSLTSRRRCGLRLPGSTRIPPATADLRPRRLTPVFINPRPLGARRPPSGRRKSGGTGQPGQPPSATSEYVRPAAEVLAPIMM